MNRLSLRTRLTILVSVAAVLTLVALTAAFNLLLRSNLDADANRVLDARTSAALEGLTVKDGTVRDLESPDGGAPDAQVWVYSGGRLLEGPNVPASVQRLADSLAQGSATGAESQEFDTRLHSAPVMSGGGRIGTVVSGLSLEPYERSASRALIGSLIFAGAALVLVLIAIRLVLARALRPVARMTEEAAEWSERDLGHRFNVGEPHDELTNLAATFDSLLQRLASSLKHEQRLSAELSHELRTPLAAIVTEAELALRRERGPDEYREALNAIASRAAHLQRTLETLLAAARSESVGRQGETADAEEVGARALEACEAEAGRRGVELQLHRPDSAIQLNVDADTAERILVPLIENGCRYGACRVDLKVLGEGDAVTFVVTDDGPGVKVEDRMRIFEPGERGEAGMNAGGDGAGLGLALARRLGRAVGGEVEVLPNGNGSGARFQARVPAAFRSGRAARSGSA